MTDWHIPLPPPDNHPVQCLCSACFASKANPRRYSRAVIKGLAAAFGQALPANAVIWLLWSVNQRLPQPQDLDRVMSGIYGGEYALMEGPLLEKKGRGKKKPLFRGAELGGDH